MPLGFTPRFCEVEEKGNLFLVRYNRPTAKNSMPNAMHCELSKVMKYYDTNASLWVAIVTGNGDAFSAGQDLKSVSGIDKSNTVIDPTCPENPAIALEGKKDLFGVPGGTGFAGLTERPNGIKPVIAAVNGIATGGGFETALACDMVIANENAQFGLTEPRVGLYAGAGGIIRLPRLMGYQNAMRWIMTGERMTAQEAKELRIVQELVPSKSNEDLMKAAEAFAERVLLCSPDAVQASIQIVKKSMNEELSVFDAMPKQGSYAAARRALKGENFKEGPKAFAQKRKPTWVPPLPVADFEKPPKAKL